MDTLRKWIALTIVAVVVIVAASWFLLISPKRSEAATIRQQADAQISANKVLEGKIALLKSQAKSLPQKQAKLAAVAAKIPDNPALPTLIRALTVAADDAGVELLTMAPSTPVPAVDPARAAAASAAAAAAAAKGGTGTPVATGTATGAVATAPRVPPAAAGAGTLKSISISITVAGGYFQIEQFFDRIESLSRAMKVASLSVAPGPNPLKPPAAGALPSALDSTLSGNITATVYMASGRTTVAVPGK